MHHELNMPNWQDKISKSSYKRLQTTQSSYIASLKDN